MPNHSSFSVTDIFAKFWRSYPPMRGWIQVRTYTDFKVTPLLDAEYLWNRTQAFEWYCFQWHWVTFEGHFSTYIENFKLQVNKNAWSLKFSIYVFTTSKVKRVLLFAVPAVYYVGNPGKRAPMGGEKCRRCHRSVTDRRIRWTMKAMQGGEEVLNCQKCIYCNRDFEIPGYL